MRNDDAASRLAERQKQARDIAAKLRARAGTATDDLTREHHQKLALIYDSVAHDLEETLATINALDNQAARIKAERKSAQLPGKSSTTTGAGK